MLGLQSLIAELKKIDLMQNENNIIALAKPLLKKTITQSDGWLQDRFYEIDETQGFGSHLIYENPDHTLARSLSYSGREIGSSRWSNTRNTSSKMD